MWDGDWGEGNEDWERGQEPHYLGEVRCLHETEKAILVMNKKDEEEYWVPKSVVCDESKVCGDGDEGELVVMTWWAEKNR